MWHHDIDTVIYKYTQSVCVYQYGVVVVILDLVCRRRRRVVGVDVGVGVVVIVVLVVVVAVVVVVVVAFCSKLDFQLLDFSKLDLFLKLNFQKIKIECFKN